MSAFLLLRLLRESPAGWGSTYNAMPYEIPIAGLQIAAFVVLTLFSLVATSAICYLLERFGLVEWIWNPPLFFLGLWACLGLGAALFLYGA